MRTSVAIFAVLCISLTMAQWPCQDWGFNGPIPNCASCTYLGSVWANQGSAFTLASDQAGKTMYAFSVCTSCTTGFYLNQTACGNCTANCNFCNLNGACNRGGCAKGYFWQPWTSLCVACPTALNCLQCELTYSSITNKWITAPLWAGNTVPNVVDTWNPVWDPIANSWNGSQTITASNYWVAPSLTIEAGYGWGPNFCTSCAYGFYIGAGGACVACPTNFASCSVSNGLLSYTCRTGYIRQWSSGVPSCMACTGNTASCTGVSTSSAPLGAAYTSSAFTNAAAANAYAGWIAVAQTTVANTITTNQSATTTAAAYIQPVVLNVATNFYLQTGATPLQFFYNYLSSGANGQGTLPTPLIGCLPGYYLNTATTCAACGTNCQQCTSNTACVISAGSCTTGNVVAITGACVSCTAANCLICDPSDSNYNSATYSTTSCAVCNAGYIMNPGTKACVACPTGCYNATPQAYGNVQSCFWNGASAICTVCAQNYTMFQNDQTPSGYTTTGIATFLTTGSAGTAIVYPNYNLIPTWGSEVGGSIQLGAVFYYNSYFWTIRGVGGTCIPLPGNCSHGQATSATQTVANNCTQCYPGFGLIYNYTTMTSSCQKCNTTGCLTCDGLGVCTTCNTTMYVQPNQCQQCPYNCSVCANATYCYNNCTKNYNWNSATGQCLPNGAERIFLAGFALLSAMLYFI